MVKSVNNTCQYIKLTFNPAYFATAANQKKAVRWELKIITQPIKLNAYEGIKQNIKWIYGHY